jgi:hypothetical protein
MSRPPSKIAAEFADQYPFGFYRNVKPVFDKTCLPCHNSQGKGLQKMDYVSVVGSPTGGFDVAGEASRYAFFFTSSQGCTMYMHQGSRTLPGRFGARESRMGKALLNGAAHQTALKNGTISAADFRKVILWLDGNSDELGAFNRAADQKAGRRVWPDLDVDSLNPTGVEKGQPLTTVTNQSAPVMQKSMSAVIRGGMLVVNNPPAAAGAYEVSLFDVTGRCVLLRSIDKESKSGGVAIDGVGMPRGSYVVRVSSPGGSMHAAKVCFW